MEMQGSPIDSTNQGMKNTSDPEAKFASGNESVGAVASDSLAASSSTFQRSNPTEPIGVEGSKSTLANTNTSGATTLPPADSTSAREANLEDQDVRYPEATGGVPKFAGSHNAHGTYSGGSVKAQEEVKRSQGETTKQYDIGNESTRSGNTTSSLDDTSFGSENAQPPGDKITEPNTTTSAGNHPSGTSVSADAIAPSYVTNVVMANVGKPKGKNLTEGGFDDDGGKNNVSYTTDVGGENDPGRAAQLKLQKLNAVTAGSNARPQEQGVSGEGAYDALGADNEA